MSALSWRAMRAGDIDDVVRVAALGFPDHPEDRACFENRLALYPTGCFALQAADAVEGYLIAYPWRYGSAPALNSLIERPPADADLIYLHDLALSPAVRGRGAAGPVLDQLVDRTRAAGLDRVALVAVNQAAPFWERHGFVDELAPGMAEKLASYGPDARYMIRRL